MTKIDPSGGTLQSGEQVPIKVTTDTTKTPGDGEYRTDLVVTFTFDTIADPTKKGREPTSAIIPLTLTVPEV